MEASVTYDLPLDRCVRLKTREVTVGKVAIGGGAPIRVQSMTTTDTNDIEASAQQSKRIVKAGGEIVRLTTQGPREAESIGAVRRRLDEMGVGAPLVADVHFSPHAAETAAGLVEAVRINPGNYTGEAKKFAEGADTMSDEEWHSLIVEKLRPLVDICKKHKTAVRIGVNHGSLSDRVMAKYGDTPEGMVASCTEYLDAFEELDFRDIVISIKSSNTRVMVQTVRLLVATMRSRGEVYPLHLGVTEAGNDAEGRVKSAAGIGALLSDGIGDTIRVSLTEAPEAEIPVARKLVEHVEGLRRQEPLKTGALADYSPFAYTKRQSVEVCGIGGEREPVVIATEDGKSKLQLQSDADWTFTKEEFEEIGALGTATRPSDGTTLPVVSASAAESICAGPLMLSASLGDLTADVVSLLKEHDDIIVLMTPKTGLPMAEMRAMALRLSGEGVKAPLIARLDYPQTDIETLQVKAACDSGALFIDGLADGIMLTGEGFAPQTLADTADLILQATRARFSRAEFISCPGCGRTLYDLQETVAAIKGRMGHLKGVKIGIMGCIVNGIGEMADADFGYVGAGPGKISLYKGKELVKRAIPQSEALDELVALIRENGKWKK